MSVQWRVSVRSEACVGTGFCADMAPERFVVESGRSRVVSATVPADEAVTDAAEACPALAVVIHDLATGAQLAPPP